MSRNQNVKKTYRSKSIFWMVRHKMKLHMARLIAHAIEKGSLLLISIVLLLIGVALSGHL